VRRVQVKERIITVTDSEFVDAETANAKTSMAYLRRDYGPASSVQFSENIRRSSVWKSVGFQHIPHNIKSLG
jgi:hypothetical protein